MSVLLEHLGAQVLQDFLLGAKQGGAFVGSMYVLQKKKKIKSGYPTDGSPLVISQSLNKKSRGTCLSLVMHTTLKWLK